LQFATSCGQHGGSGSGSGIGDVEVEDAALSDIA
jgi:hypothetical protein